MAKRSEPKGKNLWSLDLPKAPELLAMVEAAGNIPATHRPWVNAIIEMIKTFESRAGEHPDLHESIRSLYYLLGSWTHQSTAAKALHAGMRSVSGSQRGNDEKRKAAEGKRAEWQRLARDLVNKHGKLSKHRLGDMVANHCRGTEFSAKPETIRKNI